jgi:hydrogenase nickel incorporation protein HypA/HybF
VHELSLAQSIVEIVQNTARENGGGRVVTVGLRVGDLSGVVVDSLSFCFSAITSGTPLEGARLHIDRVPVRARCRDCAAESNIEDLTFLCPACGNGNLEITSGRELQVSHIEVEEESGKKR